MVNKTPPNSPTPPTIQPHGAQGRDAPDPHWTLHHTHQPRIARALAWAAATPPAETDLSLVLAKAKHGKRL